MDSSPKYMPAEGRVDAVGPAVGDAAPDFEATDADGEPFRLSSLQGQWVVLYFYPEDHTIGCTLEAKRFRDYFEAISIHQAAIVGVSRDNAGNHCSFRDKHALPFKLLCDEDAHVHDLYAAWRAPLLRPKQVIGRRCTFIIAPDGRIAEVYPKVNPVGHAQQVVRDLERIVPAYKS